MERIQKSDDKIAYDSFNTDGLFASGKSELLPDSETKITAAINTFAKNIKNTNPNIDIKTAIDYCLVVIGKTDRVPVKADPKNGNKTLSLNRAKTVAGKLSTVFNASNIKTYGIADAQCPAPQYKRDDQECRRVDVVWLAQPCSVLPKVADLMDNVVEKANLFKTISNAIRAEN